MLYLFLLTNLSIGSLLLLSVVHLLLSGWLPVRYKLEYRLQGLIFEIVALHIHTTHLRDTEYNRRIYLAFPPHGGHRACHRGAYQFTNT